MENIPHIIEIALFMVLAFLVGCILGWGLRKIRLSRTAGLATADVATTDVAATDVAASDAAPQKPKAVLVSNKAGTDNAARPPTLDKPRDGKKDNLQKIKGVGPKIELVLNKMGIYHFDQISKWDQKSVDWVDDYSSFKGRIDRDGWVEQARRFAADKDAAS